MDAPAPGDARERLELMDYKRRIFELYARVRGSEPEAGWQEWRAVRQRLFVTHPQSPVAPEGRGPHNVPAYFPYDPSWRIQAPLVAAEPETYDIGASDGGTYSFTRIGTCDLGRDAALEVYWLDGYGGGLFVPFADADAGTETYGGGRYLLDTVKGADLGVTDAGDLILDFNFAYQPSCSYDPRWSCPLAPPANRLALPVHAGERYAQEGPS
jgi:uncharacterized protein (DUF1684 family)